MERYLLEIANNNDNQFRNHGSFASVSSVADDDGAGATVAWECESLFSSSFFVSSSPSHAHGTPAMLRGLGS